MDLPRRALAWVFGVDLAAVAAVVAGVDGPPPPAALGLAAMLTLLSVVHTELATGIERNRRKVAQTSYFDLSSVWTFAGALLLSPLLAAAVVLAVYTHLWRRVWRPSGVPLHRHLYTTATVVLAAIAAHEVVTGAGGLPAGPADLAGALGVVAAALAYVVVNTVLIAVAIGLSRHTTAPRELVGRWDDNALEVATLCLGALAAAALEQTPLLAALALPPVLVLHRAVRVRHLEEVASIDGKTGLLNATTWQALADRAAAAARRAGFCAGVLIVDLDHFKAVNDAHGHLAGDDVLAAVARVLHSGVRNQDLVGRFGGEEFVVLVRELPAGSAGRAELAAVAERLRRQVARLTVQAADGATIEGLSASVGGACVGVDPNGRDGDGDLDRALRAADASLYAAKRGGRDRVRIAGDVPEDVSEGVEVPAPRAAGDARRRAASGAETVP